MNLGTHPDLVQRVWDEITTELPVDCRWVVYDRPVLVRPDTGIIFAFAGGTGYAMRLPLTAKNEFSAASLRKAEDNATKFHLQGVARDSYVQHHAGNVEKYSDRSTFDFSTLGEGWMSGRWLSGEPKWCLSAFEHAVM
jgi:hypothetical protein